MKNKKEKSSNYLINWGQIVNFVWDEKAQNGLCVWGLAVAMHVSGQAEYLQGPKSYLCFSANMTPWAEAASSRALGIMAMMYYTSSNLTFVMSFWNHYHSHFSNQGVKAQIGSVTCVRWHTWRVELKFVLQYIRLLVHSLNHLLNSPQPKHW